MKRMIVMTALAVMLIAMLVFTTSCINIDGGDALAMLEAANNVKLEEQKAEYEAKLEELEAEYKAQIDSIVLGYENEIASLRTQLEANDLDREAIEQSYKRELEEAYASMEAEKNELEESYTSQIAELRAKIAECDEMIAEYTDRLQSQENYYKNMILKLESEKDDLQGRYNEKLSELEAIYGSHSQEIADLRADYDARIRQLENELNAVKGQLSDTNSYYESVLAERNATVESLHAQINSINSEYNSQIAKLKNDHDSEIAKLKSEYETTINGLNNTNMSLNSKIADLEARIADLTMNARYLVVIDYGLEGYGSTMMLVNANASITAPVYDVPDGYTLSGWEIDGVPITFPYTVVSDVTIVARVVAEPHYTIMYHTFGGMFEGTVPNNYQSSTGVSVLPTPIRAHYVFAGWYDNPEYSGDRIYSIAPGTVGYKMLYARWTPVDTGVEYTLWGGNAYAVTGYSGSSSTAVIADEIDGIPVTILRMNAFKGSGVSTLVIGNNITSIDTSLAASTSIEEIRVSSENTKYKVEGAFLIEEKNGSKTLVYYPTGRVADHINVPEGITSIGEYAFAGSDIQSITLPVSLKSIGLSAFETCYSLREVWGTSSVTYIGMWAFEYCEALVSIVLPATLSTVDSHAFDGCTSLERVFYCGTAFDWSVVNIASGNNDSLRNATRYYYSATKPTDNGYYWYFDNGIATPWNSVGSRGFTYAQHTGANTCMITGLGDCTDSDIIIPEYIDGYRVTEIGAGAFDGCSSIKSVRIPGSVKIIHSYAFETCENLTDIYLEEGVVEIGDQAFSESGATTVVLPKSLKCIGWNAFYGCIKLDMVFYAGTKSEWEAMGLTFSGTYDTAIGVAYYSSSLTPGKDKVWHYDASGEPVLWF